MHTPENTLETGRLLLRRLDAGVYAFIFDTFTDAEIMAFFDFSTPGELERERERYHKGLAMHNKSFLWFLMVEKQSGRVIGSCGYHTWYTPHRRAEIGYALTDPAKHGQGFMKEAMAAVIRYGFVHMDLHRIEAFVAPDNPASLALVRGFGFRQEGHLREHYFKDGRMEDSLVFSLLQHEYMP